MRANRLNLRFQQEVEITWDNQKKINEFSRLNMKKGELQGDIKRLKEELDRLEDAGTMIEEAMGDPLK